MSFVLGNTEGYQFGIDSDSITTHNFFVGDLSLYANNINPSKKQLNIRTTFCKDVPMIFGKDKCTYQKTENW